MIRRLARISPWQTAKTLAVVYFALGLLFAVPVGLISSLIPDIPGQTKPSLMFLICMPFLYALAALVFVPLGCWFYNLGARFMGGIEVTVTTPTDA